MSNLEEKITEDRFLKLVDALEDFFGSEVYMKKMNIKRLKQMKSLAEKEYELKLLSCNCEHKNSDEEIISRGYVLFHSKLLDEQIEYEIESYKEMKRLDLTLTQLNFTYLSNSESSETD